MKNNENNQNSENKDAGLEKVRGLYARYGLSYESEINRALHNYMDTGNQEVEDLLHGVMIKIFELVDSGRNIDEIELTEFEQRGLSLLMVGMVADTVAALYNATQDKFKEESDEEEET